MWIILLMVNLLFAVDVYVDGHLNFHLPKIFHKKPFNGFDKNGFFVITQKDIPKVLNNKFEVLNTICQERSYIISYKSLDKIKTLANANLAIKAFFNKTKKLKYVHATIEDFKNKKVDAIVVHKKIYIPNTKIYDLKDFGIIENKYFLVAKKEFLKKHKKEAQLLNSYLPATSSDELVLVSCYLNKPLNFSSLYYKIFEEDVTNDLKVVVTPYWPPFNIKDGDRVLGIAIDFWKLVAKKLNLKYTILVNPSWSKLLEGIKNGVYDLNPATSETPDRRKYAIFTKPYVEFPLAIACKEGLKIKNIQDIKSLAVGKNYTAHKMMLAHYPRLHYVPALSVMHAFKLVEEGKAQCVVDMLPTIVWLINQNNYGFMKIYFKTPFKFKVQMMLRKDLVGLRNRLNQVIDEITIFEKNKIISKYLGHAYIIKKDNTILYILFGIIIVVSTIFVVAIYKYKKRAEIDYLTQIYNRAAIEEILKKLLKESDGAIIFFDIDHFKKINDTYGHEKGDFVLKKLAKVIKSHIRRTDYFGRWGGEEFLIILPNSTYEGALKKAEMLRKIVEKTDFDGIKVTISLGVTEYKKGEDIDEVINRADEALYEAKNSGRNQVKGKR